MPVSGLISGSGSAQSQTTHGPLTAHPSRDLLVLLNMRASIRKT
jgi:hypothetical protein